MKQTRREFLKTNAAAATAAVAGITSLACSARWRKVTLSGAQQALPGGGEAIRSGQGGVPILWDRLLRPGRRQGRARRGDAGRPDAPVNRGLNCIKGYFLSDHVRQGPPDQAAAAQEERQVRQGG